MSDDFRTATDAEMVQWLRLRTDSDPAPRDEQLIAARLAEKLQSELGAAHARAEALAAEVAALRAELAAAGEWRAVDDLPPAPSMCLVWDGFHYGFCYYTGKRWRSRRWVPFTHWKPLPAPPQE